MLRSSCMLKMLGVFACCALRGAVAFDANSFKGQFEIVPRAVERCPSTLEGLALSDIKTGFKQDPKFPQRYYLTGDFSYPFNISDDLSMRVKVAMHTLLGWREIFSRTVENACSIAKVVAPEKFRDAVMAAFGEMRDCPFPAMKVKVNKYPVDVPQGFVTEGKWRADTQVLKNDKVLTCVRLFVDTVPRSHQPVDKMPKPSYENTVQYEFIDAKA